MKSKKLIKKKKLLTRDKERIVYSVKLKRITNHKLNNER